MELSPTPSSFVTVLALLLTSAAASRRTSQRSEPLHREALQSYPENSYKYDRSPSSYGEYDYSSKYSTRSAMNRKDRARKTTPPFRDKKPNIILVLTDDQDIELGSMNFMPKTLRILGDGGAHFSNAYVTTPMCCPSRSSMLTGLYVHNHQVHTNNDNCSSPWWQQEHETRTFATYLNNAGYRTAYFGKYLNEYNGSYIPPGWREWVALIRNSRFYNYSINVNGNKIRHGDNYFRDYYPDLIANDSINFLRRSKRHFTNKPVMMVLSFPSPHGPEDAAPHYQHLFHNVTTHRTPSWNFAPNPDKQWLLRNTGKMEPVHVKFTDVLHTKRLQTLQTVDDAVERLYRELRILGELENTYIFYTSDHGYHLGQFGLVKGKSMPFEFDVRVPFFVRGPRAPRGVRMQDIVLNIDLAPTFLDIAGVEIPEHMDGRSVLSLLKDADAWASSGHRHTEVRRKKTWRDSFLIERGKNLYPFSVINSSRKGSKHVLPSASPPLPKLTKDQRLSMECRKPQYSSPCLVYQKWECVHDGYRWRIQKCRSYVIKEDNCVCPDDEDLDYLDWGMEEFRQRAESKAKLHSRKRKHMDFQRKRQEEKRLQRLYLSRQVNADLDPLFLGSRWKRSIDGVQPHELFDVESVEELFMLLDAAVGNRTEEMEANGTGGEETRLQEEEEEEDIDAFTEPSTATEDREKRETPASFQLGIHNECVLLPNGTRTCIDEQRRNPVHWKERKEKLDLVIRKLRQKLEELKGLRKQLKKTRPPPGGKQYFPPDIYEEDYYRKSCRCNSGTGSIDYRQQVKDERRQRREDLRRQRQQRKEDYYRKMERKIRRKTKFENMTCNAEKMNCFTQDNNHWKTPPLWTDGPFCFCQNSNNNTFWCLRTINETHNFLYCEFVTGFITFYDLRTDPYQMRNAVHDLDFGTLEKLRMQLNKLRSCKGAKECTMRYKPEPSRNHPQRQRSFLPPTHSMRHWRSNQRWSLSNGKRQQQQWSHPDRHPKWKS